MHKKIVLGFSVFFVVVAVVVCGCRQTSLSVPIGASDLKTYGLVGPALVGEKPQLSVKEKVDRADLIVIANRGVMFGSRIKNVYLENVEVLWGKLPVGKEVVVTLRFHPLLLTHTKSKFLFYLAKPEKMSDAQEVRPLIGKESDQDGVELATDSNVEKVREAIQNKKER